MRKKNDILWKGMIEEVFDDLLRFFFPEADQIFDMQRGFEFLDKELAEMYPEPEKDSNTRLVDKLVKVHRRDGLVEWLLVHLEVQGDRDKNFPERMFRYYYRIFDRYQKPVTAIAIFTGLNMKNMPDSYEYSFLGTHLLYQYNTFCITDPPEKELEKSKNPFALVVLAARKALLSEKITIKELLEQKLLVAKLLLSKKHFSRKKIEGILSFLNNYIPFDDQKTNRIFETQLDKITGKINTMGIIEQLTEIKVQEARLEERKKASAERKKARVERESIVRRLLADTEFSVEKIASLAGVTLTFVEKVKESLSSK